MDKVGSAISLRGLAARRRGKGVMLLEVVLALALFFVTAGVIFGGLDASIGALRRLRLEAQAADLAVTLLSEIQMGLVPAADDGPNSYPEAEALKDWTWQIVTAPAEQTVEGPPFKQVRIVIVNTARGYTYRLGRLMPDEAFFGQNAEGEGSQDWQ